MYLDQIKELTKFEYAIMSPGDPECYQFGWKDGKHFYLDDYKIPSQHEGRFILVCWSGLEMLFVENFREIESVIQKINEILNT